MQEESRRREGGEKEENRRKKDNYTSKIVLKIEFFELIPFLPRLFSWIAARLKLRIS